MTWLLRDFSSDTFTSGFDSVGSNKFAFSCKSRALFMRPVSTDFSKFFFKIGSHGIIHIFKNYFTIIFLVFNFQE